MKKILLKTVLLLCALVVGSSAWADTVTFDASVDVSSNVTNYSTSEATYTASDGSVWKAKGYGASANTSLTIGKGGANYLQTPEVNGTITSVTVTWTGNTDYYLALQTTSGTELEAKKNTSASQTYTFEVDGEYSQLRLVGRRSSGNSNAAATITRVVVEYSLPSSVDAPVITPVNGTTFASTLNVTITQDDADLILYTTDGTTVPTYDDWGDEGVYEATSGTAFAISTSTTIIAVAFDGSGNASPRSRSYFEKTSVEAGVKDIPMTYTLFGKTASGSQDGTSLTGSRFGISFDVQKISGTNAPYVTDAQVRLYANYTLTISVPSGHKMTSIIFSEPESDKVWNDNAITVNTGTYTSATKTWSGEADEITFSFSGQCRIGSIRVSVEEGLVKKTLSPFAFSESDFLTTTTSGVVSGTPSLTKPDDYTGTITYSSSDQTVATVNSEGVVTALKEGDVVITASGEEDAKYKAGVVTYNLRVGLKDASLTFDDNVITTYVNNGEINAPSYTKVTNATTIYYSSSNSEIVAVEDNTLKIKGVGTVTITGSMNTTSQYKACNGTFTVTVNKAEAGIAFPDNSYQADEGKAFANPTLTNPNNLPVVYSSSDETIATVANDGTISALNVGYAIIKANFAGNEYFNQCEASYTLTVRPRYIVTFHVNGETQEVREESYGAGVTVPTPITIDGYSFKGWRTSALATTNDEPSYTTPTTTGLANNDGVYYAVYALKGVGADETVDLYTNTGSTGSDAATGITAAGNVNTNSSNGNPGYSFGLTSSSNTTITFSNIDLSDANSAVVAFDYRLSKANNKYSSLTLTQYDSNNDAIGDATVVTNTDQNYHTSADITLSTSCVKFTIVVSPANGTTYNTFVDNVKIKVTRPSISYSGYTTERITGVENRSMATGKIGTICLPYAVKAADIEGATVYTVAGKTMDGENLQYVTISELEGDMVAGTPYIFKATADAQSFTFVPTNKANAAGSANGLVGAFEETEITRNDGNYIFSGGLLYLVDSEAYVGANRAYIHLASVPDNTPSEVKGINIFADGVDPTAISAPYITVQSGVYYNLQGQRVENPTHGIYILNGKKVFIK